MKMSLKYLDISVFTLVRRNKTSYAFHLTHTDFLLHCDLLKCRSKEVGRGEDERREPKRKRQGGISNPSWNPRNGFGVLLQWFVFLSFKCVSRFAVGGKRLKMGKILKRAAENGRHASILKY